MNIVLEVKTTPAKRLVFQTMDFESNVMILKYIPLNPVAFPRNR